MFKNEEHIEFGFLTKVVRTWMKKPATEHAAGLYVSGIPFRYFGDRCVAGPLSYGVEFPFSIVSVNLTEYHGRIA